MGELTFEVYLIDTLFEMDLEAEFGKDGFAVELPAPRVCCVEVLTRLEFGVCV